MRNVRIEPKREGKGRTFRAVMLASVEADLLWSGGKSENLRPVWAMFAGSDQELRAFMANLTSGRLGLCDRAEHYRHGKEDRLELLKSARYRTIWQREQEGSLATVFLPELFKLDPGMVNPEGVGFVLLPTREWHAQQALDTEVLAQHVERCGYAVTREWVQDWAATAYLFAAYLDRRTRCPLVQDGRFYMQLMLASLKHGLASFSAHDMYSRDFGVHAHHKYYESGIEPVGFRPGLVFRAQHPEFESMLAQEVELYFGLSNSRSTKKVGLAK